MARKLLALHATLTAPCPKCDAPTATPCKIGTRPDGTDAHRERMGWEPF